MAAPAQAIKQVVKEDQAAAMVCVEITLIHMEVAQAAISEEVVAEALMATDQIVMEQTGQLELSGEMEDFFQVPIHRMFSNKYM
jgi:hypothetical protein